MKEYNKPTVEFIEMRPEERLANVSAGGGAQAVCNGNDGGSFQNKNQGCEKADN